MSPTRCVWCACVRRRCRTRCRWDRAAWPPSSGSTTRRFARRAAQQPRACQGARRQACAPLDRVRAVPFVAVEVGGREVATGPCRCRVACTAGAVGEQHRRRGRNRTREDSRCADSAGLRSGTMGRGGPQDQVAWRDARDRVRSGQGAHETGFADRPRAACGRSARPGIDRSGVEPYRVRSTAMNLSNQMALVTGASRGIGRAIALELGRQGANVVGTATSETGAQAISAAFAEAGVRGRGEALDVTDPARCEALIDVLQKEGGVAILVNNAGITRDKLAMRMKDDEWNAVIDTNLGAVFRMSRLVMRAMMRARYGRIVNITSVVGSSGNAGQANYAAAKAGVAGMSRALARELASRN